VLDVQNETVYSVRVPSIGFLQNLPLCQLLSPQVDYLALSGLSGVQFAAVLGHSAQAMSTFTTLHSMLNGLVVGKGPTPADVAASVVQAVYGRVKAQSPTNASKVGCVKMLMTDTVTHIADFFVADFPQACAASTGQPCSCG